MKKLVLVLLFLSTTSILADQPLILSPRHIQGTGPNEIVMTDGVVYSQPYSWELLDNAVTIMFDRWFCDDFELDNDYYITDIYVWTIWMGEQASVMNLVISEDDINDSDPNTNIDVWSESVPCIHTFTGDSNWGFDIYETHCVIDTDIYPELNANIHYYLEIQAGTIDYTGILFSWYCVEDCAWWDDGSGVWVSMDTWWTESDGFFVLEGELVYALEPETWGSIKTLF